tara:strand:- start:438 stop:1838 length:1401 start_codon:yes stop_codon:yes gene_type:complete
MKSKKIIHFIGIGGIGMSGIAEVMLDRGYLIQGSDIKINENIRRLRKKGAKIFLKHAENNIKNISTAVFSSAIDELNPEIIQCKKLSIPLVRRADMLAELMRGKKAIAVAGSHGKTTTTSLVGSILDYASLDPTIINGGIINAYSKNNRLGSGKWVVAEADESDGSFIRLPHEINIITNIDIEHMEHYKKEKNLIKAFETFITSIPFYGYSIICYENESLKKISKKIKNRKFIKYSSASKSADVYITNVKTVNLKTNFTIFIKKNVFQNYSGKYNFKINLLGNHNVLNATASIIASLLAGVSIEKIQSSLENFLGVKRRFTLVGKIKKSLIYDDYAHHPTEIKASYQIAKLLKKKKIIVIFQPHRYSRTSILYKDFLKELAAIDILFLLDIYPAGEKPIKNISSKKIVKDLKRKNKSVYYLHNKTNIYKKLSSYFNNENLIIFMGAGSITYEAYKLIEFDNVQKNS